MKKKNFIPIAKEVIETELKSLKEVDMAQRKGAITKQAHSTTKKYFKNVYNFGILFSHQNLR